jgi:hypothetical protein
MEAKVPYWGCAYIFWFSNQFPKYVRALTSQHLAAAYNMLHCFRLILQNLQVGSPLNWPIIYRCLLTGTCPVRITTTIFSWCLLNLSRSSALVLHGLPMKSLPLLEIVISELLLTVDREGGRRKERDSVVREFSWANAERVGNSTGKSSILQMLASAQRYKW